MHLHEIWLKDLLVFLFAAGLVVPLLRLFHVPAVLGFLLAGIALGPWGTGMLADTWPVLSFVSITEPATAQPFAELGILFLLFLLGLELSFDRLWTLRRIVLGAGGIQALVSAVVIAAAVVAWGFSPPAAIAVGLAMALSSTAIVMQVLVEERRAAAPVGRAALAVLLFQDILVAPILILVGFLGREGASLGAALFEAIWQGAIALALIVAIGRFFLRDAFGIAARAGGRDFLMGITLLTVVGGAVITAGAGLSLALGAFLAGLLLGETEFKHQTEVDLEPFKGLLLGLFFMTVGMALDLETVWNELWLVVAGLIVLLVVKGLIAWGALRLVAGDGALAIEAAFMLAPAGEFAFVVISAALAAGVIGGEIATAVTAIAGLSMLVTPLMARAGRTLAARLAPRDGEAELEDLSGLSGHVVIAGFGRVGHAIARILESEGTDIVALERNAALVARERRQGGNVFVGDAARPEILERAGARGASLFVVTIDDPESAEAMVHAIRRLRPEAPLLVRARDADHARRLMAVGASFVIPDAIEAGLQLAGRALEEFGYPGETVRDRIAAERDAEYRRATE